MPRAATLSSRITVALLAPLLLLSSAARAGQPGGDAPKPDLGLQVVILAASGRAEKAQFHPRIPPALRRQIEDQNLAYGKYDLLGIQRKDARFGADVTFDLPEKETLVLRPSADEGSPNRVRLGCRLLDDQKKPILVNTMRVSYDRAFIIQRSRGPASSLLMGISAHKPSDAPPKP